MLKKSSLTGVMLVAALLLLSACTRVVTIRAPAHAMPSASMPGTEERAAWRSITFRMRWDPEQTPDWYLDALLADQVCAPAMIALGSQISLWRFHRRAANDRAGHQFSLLVYSNAVSADALFRRIRDASLLQWLESDGSVESLSITEMNHPDLPPIADTSDAAWPREIQASWPWFIMGVSQTWLSLIGQVTVEQPLEDPSPAAMLDYYRTVNDQVTALWRDHGQHVYLHHLNALFGYEPLIIRETNLKRF